VNHILGRLNVSIYIVCWAAILRMHDARGIIKFHEFHVSSYNKIVMVLHVIIIIIQLNVLVNLSASKQSLCLQLFSFS
jgi:hypothetical protein